MGLSYEDCKKLGIESLHPQSARSPASHPAGKRRPRVPGQMNRNETRFAETLEGMRLLGQIRSWAYEPETFVLAPRMTFLPDFKVEARNVKTLYIDVKGKHIWEDATVKIKIAAVLFPQHSWAQAKWEGRGWRMRYFPSC